MEEAEQIHDETQAVVEPQAQESPSVSEPEDISAQAKNFRELRHIVREQQRQIRELEAQRHYQAQAAKDDDDDDDDFGLADDDIPSWGQIQKAIDKRAEKKAREAIQKNSAEFEEDRVRIRHKDYDEVVTEENIKNLVDDDPVLATAIRNSANPYEAAYKLIKKSAFYKESASTKNSPVAKKIDENSAKPKSSHSIQTERPLAAAHSFASMDEKDRQALWREMQNCSSRRS